MRIAALELFALLLQEFGRIDEVRVSLEEATEGNLGPVRAALITRDCLDRRVAVTAQDL